MRKSNIRAISSSINQGDSISNYLLVYIEVLLLSMLYIDIYTWAFGKKLSVHLKENMKVNIVRNRFVFLNQR